MTGHLTEKHLDPEVLSALEDVMADEYPALLETFLADSEERVKQLHSAGNAEQLIRAAHSLKGSSSNMGAIRLAGLCHELEQQARQKPLPELKKLLGEVVGEFAIVQRLYNEERQRFQC